VPLRGNPVIARAGVVAGRRAGANGGAEAFRAAIEQIARIVEKTPDASRPVPGQRLRFTWPPRAPISRRARRARAASRSVVRKVKVLVRTLLYFLVMHFGITVGRFIPAKYTRELIDNSDFRKFDDSLRMVLDCTPELADEIERHLAACASQGVVRYGTHRQQAAMMTCFTPSPTNSNHVHFIDGGDGRLCDGGQRDEGRRLVPTSQRHGRACPAIPMCVAQMPMNRGCAGQARA
jgi:hypothetical protein